MQLYNCSAPGGSAAGGSVTSIRGTRIAGGATAAAANAAVASVAFASSVGRTGLILRLVLLLSQFQQNESPYALPRPPSCQTI